MSSRLLSLHTACFEEGRFYVGCYRCKRLLVLLHGFSFLIVIQIISTGCTKSIPSRTTNSTVYIGTDNAVYALDAMTGKQKWIHSGIGSAFGSPTVAGNMVIIGSTDGTLYGLDTANGSVLQSFHTGKAINASPTLAGGILYFANLNDSIFAISANSFEVKWAVSTKNQNVFGLWSSPTVANGTVYIGGDYEFLLYAFDAASGNKLWSDSSNFEVVYSSPLVANGTVYATNSDYGLFAVDASTGKIKWNATLHVGLHASPTFADGILYAVSNEGLILALDPESGAIHWTYATSGAIDASPVVSNGVLYIGDFTSTLYAIDSKTGATVWTSQIGGSGSGDLYNGPTVANGIVYVGSVDHAIYAVASVTGHVLWSFDTDPNTTIESGPCVTASDGKVYQPGISGEQD